MKKRKVTNSDGVMLVVLASGAIGSCVGGGAMADAGHVWTGVGIIATGAVLAVLFGIALVGLAFATEDDEAGDG